MDLFLQLLVNGLINGSHYALLGIGFGLIFSTTRLVHFAYGPIYTFAAYTAWTLSTQLGLPMFVALAGAILVAMLMGMGSYLILYRPLERREAPVLIPLIASLGLTIVLENLVSIIFGSGVRSLDFSGSIHFAGPVFYTSVHVWQIIAFFVIIGALTLFLQKTKYGKSILAMTDEPEMARVIGINTIRISYLVFALGSAIAAVTAVLILTKDGANSHMGFHAVFMAFVAVIIGGVGSIRGAIAGGLLVGLVESLGLWQIPTEWQGSISFVVLFLMLMVRPEGLYSMARK